MVEFYLLTFPRFPLRKKENKSYLGKNRTHDFRISRCAGYLLHHSGDVLKRGKGFQKFKHVFLLKANTLYISGHFVGQRVRAVPVGDPLKQKAVLLREGLSSEEIRGGYQAWNFLDAALQSEEDRAILKRFRSPREVFKFPRKWYDPENEVATQYLFDKFHEFSIPQNSNPIAELHALEDINNQTEEKGMGQMPDTVLHARFFHALPAEYDHAKEALQSMTNRDSDEIIHVVSTRYSNLPQKKGAQRSFRTPQHAFFSSESEGRGGARRGRGRSRKGGRGSSHGGTSSGGGDHSSSSSASGNTGRSQGSSRGNNGASSSGSGSGGGSSNTPPGRCWRCRRRHHSREECTTKESDFVPRCARCSGFGHEESACASDVTILVMELPGDNSNEENAFAENPTGMCSLRIGEEAVGEGLDKQVA